MENLSQVNNQCDDSEWLSSWIDTRHLQKNFTQTCCQTLAESPVKMLKLNNFLKPEAATRLSAFLEKDAKYKRKYGLRSKGKKQFGDDHTVSFDEWNEADEKDRFFKFDCFDGFQTSDLNKNIAAYLKFIQSFNDFRFINYLNSITGIETDLQKVTINCVSMSKGDYLREHKDDHDSFRLAYIFYLSKNWEPNFGGKLQLLDASGNSHTVEPHFNTFVIFSVAEKMSHYVESLKSECADWQRRTISGWLYEQTD